MNVFEESNHEFWNNLAATKTREELLELIEIQNPDLIPQINRVEWVFRNKLTHLTWKDGTPVTERPFTNQELAYLIDPIFEPKQFLLDLDISPVQQKNIHTAADTVLWAKHFLKQSPRVYQILMLRDPNRFKVLRSGRRLGKTYTMALKLMHYSYVNKNGRSIVLAPMQAQATLIFEEVMKLAANSQEMKEAIVRDKKSPPAEINLSNGSIIRFFTTGMKTASKSDSTRGQEAHLIVLDELDYMGDDDLEAVLAMMQKTDENQPDKQLIGASTPTGRRSIFWQWCTDPDSAFSEFWFPSYANPYFDKETEDMLRNEYTETGWRHEIEADWGEDVQGVYPRRYLDQAFSAFEPWEYDLYPDPASIDQDSFFVFGVDWDKYGAGTNIVVLQVFGKSPVDPSMKNKVRVFYREEVARDEYTFVNATRRIIELNDLLKPRHIYIDRGAGETQAEMLHLYGKDNKASGLHKKVRGVQFSENVEVRDPYTKELMKKPVKPYMVDNLRLMLERKQIFFPEHDEELYMQLISYVVVRESEAGKPVFEMSSNRVEDHAHDALILACLGITENYGDLHNVKVDFSSIAFNSSFLMPEEKKVDTISEEKEDRKDGKVPFTLKRSLSSRSTRGGRGHISRSTF